MSEENRDVKYDRLLEHRKDDKNAIRKQKEIIAVLENEGFKTYQIAQILNITEYRLKRIKSD